MATYTYKESGSHSPKIYQFACPDCGHNWDVLMSPKEPPPESCPECDKLEVQGPIPATRSIGGSPLARSVDKMYRDLETTSAARAEIAGAPELKITNLKDGFYGGGMKQGDIAAPTVKNTVTDFVDQTAGGNYFGATAPGGVPVEQLVAAGGTRRTNSPGQNALRMIQSGNGRGAGTIPPRR